MVVVLVSLLAVKVVLTLVVMLILETRTSVVLVALNCRLPVLDLSPSSLPRKTGSSSEELVGALRLSYRSLRGRPLVPIIVLGRRSAISMVVTCLL
jgi:hypothetical protein